MSFSLEKAPHIASKRTTRGIMGELSAVLLVVFLYSMIWYFVTAGANYGTKAILNLVISLVSAVGADALFALPNFWNKKVTDVKEKFKNFGLQIIGSYGYVSGLIFTLLVPIGTPLYVIFVGAFIGTLLAKDIFGGFGKNVFNPAIVGRVFVQICFPSMLKSYLGTTAPDTVATGATIMTETSSLGWTTNLNGISLLDLILGNYRGTLGETFAFLIIIAAIYLVVRKIIDWRIPAFYLVTLLLIGLFIGVGSGLGVNSFEFALRQILIGGALFGSVFCLTDPVTAPTSRAGKAIYAVSAAVITALIRYQASAVEGVAYSILIVNMCAPLISKLLVSKSNKKLPIKGAVIGGIAVLGVIFGVTYGVVNKTSDRYNSNIARYDQDAEVYNLVLDTAKKNASGYKTVEAKMDSASGTINKKIAFTMDDAKAAYYELSTNPALSYKQPTETESYYVTFGIIVNDNGTVGYKYLSGNEHEMGIGFAKEISITPENPYIKGDLVAANVNSDLIQTGASSPLNSTKTVPAILTAILGAETEYGLSVKTTVVDNLNTILGKQNINKLTVDDVTVMTNPTMPNAEQVGNCTLLLDGFKINNKDASYYEVTTPTKKLDTEYGSEDVTITLGVLVNGDGIVGLNAISLTVGTGVTEVKSLVSAITISNPFKSTDKVGTFGDIVFTGASEYTSVTVDAVLQSCLTAFGGN